MENNGFYFDFDDSYAYTDLAIERRRADISCDGVDYRICESDGGTWECVRIYSPEGELAVGRKQGIYDTLNTERFDLLSESDIGDATEEISRKLCEIFDTVGIFPERLLICGLGNRGLTPDALGPRSCDLIRPTMHIATDSPATFSELECSEIAILCPGVLATSGLESAEVIRGIARRILPNAVIAIDSLAARESDRLGTTIQISSTGIYPGSAVNGKRSAINEDTLGVPVIAIGVPTVIDTRAFCHSVGGKHAGEPMIVAPKEIDEITNIAARIIGGAINQAFGLSEF